MTLCGTHIRNVVLFAEGLSGGTVVGTNGLLHGGKPVGLEELCKLRLDAGHSAGTPVDKKGVNLSRGAREREKPNTTNTQHRGGGCSLGWLPRSFGP